MLSTSYFTLAGTTSPTPVRNTWIKLFESYFNILIGIAFMYIILIFFS